MSSQALPEMNPPSRPAEVAPSQMTADEPRWARTLGLIGMMIAVFGLTVVGANGIFGPRIVAKNFGFVFLAVGFAAMLFHAVRDGDFQIRRMYGWVGYFLLGLMVVLAIANAQNFLAYGWACSLVGLGFLMTFSKHETDLDWRKRILVTIGAVGAVMIAIGFIGGLVADGFLLTYGLLLTILGLIYLCAFINQTEPTSELGHKAGLAIGGVAIFAILYAVFRSVVPALLKMQVSPFFVPTGLLLMFLGVVYGAVSLAIVSDNRLVVQTRREFTSYFYSPVAYIVMLGMALLGAAAYYLFESAIVLGIYTFEPIVQHYFGAGGLPPLIVLFIVPAITMRLMAEERRSGTYEVLMCAPVKETTVVLSKFIAGLVFFVMLWSIWALYLIGLRAAASEPFDYRPVLSFYLAVTVCGSGFISMGLFFSCLSKNQIIAAVLTFMGMLALALMGILKDFGIIGPLWRSVFGHLSYQDLWQESLRGRLHVRDMILQGSFSIFWLFLTVKVLEARRWS